MVCPCYNGCHGYSPWPSVCETSVVGSSVVVTCSDGQYWVWTQSYIEGLVGYSLISSETQSGKICLEIILIVETMLDLHKGLLFISKFTVECQKWPYVISHMHANSTKQDISVYPKHIRIFNSTDPIFGYHIKDADDNVVKKCI